MIQTCRPQSLCSMFVKALEAFERGRARWLPQSYRCLLRILNLISDLSPREAYLQGLRGDVLQGGAAPDYVGQRLRHEAVRAAPHRLVADAVQQLRILVPCGKRGARAGSQRPGMSSNFELHACGQARNGRNRCVDTSSVG